MGQSEGFLGKLLGPLLENGLPLMKTQLKTLAKSVLTLFNVRGWRSVGAKSPPDQFFLCNF